MKRLITSLLLALGILFAPVAASAFTSPYWELNMYNPSATTDRKINIAYHVFSTTKTDTFKVELFQNVTTKLAEDNITHEFGDSGAFTVDLPASGTYSYMITATNNTDLTEKSESRTVQVVDGPAPTVTTVFVNNAGAAGGGQGAGGAAAGAQAAATPEGQVAGAAAQEGQVSEEAATDTQKGDVLGAAAKVAATNNRGRNIAIGTIVAVVVLGGAYYWFLARPRNSA